MELQRKLQRILGITPDALKQYDPMELVDELCETVIMLDDQNVIAQLTALREKLTAINGRIWNLLGQHDPKKARENLSGIAELERYVGEVKRRSGDAEQPAAAPAPEKRAAPAAEGPPAADDERIRSLESRVGELQDDLQNLFHALMEVEELEEEARGVSAGPGAAPSSAEHAASG
jgi:TolA-binding protein